MNTTTRTKRLNRQLFASISCGLLICCFSLLLIIERNYTYKQISRANPLESNPKFKSKKTLECYQHNNSSLDTDEYEIDYLDDLMQTEPEPNPNTGANIFFHETTCSRSGLVYLNARQACAIESAAKLHPLRDVFVLFASPVGFRDRFANFPANIQALKTYPNIHFRNNNLWKYAKGTPLEKWINDGDRFGSADLFEHMSHVLRYLTLYKFGGIFLDLDVIVQQSFDELGENFVGSVSDITVGCGVLHFGNDRLGRKIAEHCMRLLIDRISGKTHNNRSIITTAVQRMCKTKDRNSMTHEQCDGFNVYPESMFYGVPRSSWKWFFDPLWTDHTIEMTKNSTVVRLWNDLSRNSRVKIGAHTAYEMVAKRNCPKVYNSRINYEYF